MHTSAETSYRTPCTGTVESGGFIPNQRVLDMPLDIDTDGLGILGRLLVFAFSRDKGVESEMIGGRDSPWDRGGRSCKVGIQERGEKPGDRSEPLAGSSEGTGFSERKESLDLPRELGTRERNATKGALEEGEAD